MQKRTYVSTSLSALFLGAALMFSPAVAQTVPPNFTLPGVIQALKTTPGYASRPYSETFNLGATGMRGWISDLTDRNDAKVLGLSTHLSRMILVTTVGPETPAQNILQIDDVILGVSWGVNYLEDVAVPVFSGDARKEFGRALTKAEEGLNGGYLNIKRWRNGVTTNVQLKLPTLGSYSNDIKIECEKSKLILKNARAKLVVDLQKNPNLLFVNENPFVAAVNGLALLSAVPPGDPAYIEVQQKLKEYAESLSPANLTLQGCNTWNWSYINIFLCEYYLHIRDANLDNTKVLAGLNKYTVALAKAQSRYGTFGTKESELKSDGNLHGTVAPYGALNCAGLAANISIVLGKKALSRGGQTTIDAEIDPAIERSNKFFAYYVNKGMIPYGEHIPDLVAHAPNGKDQMCAVLFSLQENHQSETEYFSRASVAAYGGREEGHCGTGFNYLWEGMGAHAGGPLALAEYLNKIRWNLDLQRRSDGSFVYDGQATAANAGSSTADGSYLGLSAYYGLNPTSYYILTYSSPLKRLYITGKSASHILSPSMVENAIAAGSFQLDCESLNYSNADLIAKLSEYDPVTRQSAAKQLLARNSSMPLSVDQKSGLIASITNGTTLANNVNARVGACTVLGLLKEKNALSALTQRMNDSDHWVRAKAAEALIGLKPDDSASELDNILGAIVRNATDAEEILWDDPLKKSISHL